MARLVIRISSNICTPREEEMDERDLERVASWVHG